VTPGDRERPRLSAEGRDRLFDQLGVKIPQADLEGLSTLVRAWLLGMPFHNLDLLAATLGDRRSLTAAEALSRCMNGLGGPCHVHALGFMSILEAAGFEAELCAATIGQPDDHLLVRVVLNGKIYLCDVGNGQPYLTPFGLDSVTEVTHLGWRIVSEPIEQGIRLKRWSPDLPAGRVVYKASQAPRRWADFADAIHHHHSSLGFGPFMTGLRAVRIHDDRMETLRDTLWTTYRQDGYDVRPVALADLGPLLGDVFRLGDLPVSAALRAWCLAREGMTTR
jgi:arylamine N-acetyltransferase